MLPPSTGKRHPTRSWVGTRLIPKMWCWQSCKRNSDERESRRPRRQGNAERQRRPNRRSGGKCHKPETLDDL
ncbi:hypothetical protein ID866_8359 [Astraeus odoratus]|nr:hypothetical protein ID866_8359 [Astraeus odoratus]